MLGQTDFTLTCEISGADNLRPIIDYQWTTSDGTPTPIRVGDNHRVLSFSQPLSLCDAGQYTCQVTIMSNLLNNDIRATSHSYNVTFLGEFGLQVTVCINFCEYSGISLLRTSKIRTPL